MCENLLPCLMLKGLKLKHVDGLVDKQEILIYYTGSADNHSQIDMTDLYVLPCHFSYNQFEHFFQIFK